MYRAYTVNLICAAVNPISAGGRSCQPIRRFAGFVTGFLATGFFVRPVSESGMLATCFGNGLRAADAFVADGLVFDTPVSADLDGLFAVGILRFATMVFSIIPRRGYARPPS
jgi:hypothetical protein